MCPNDKTVSPSSVLFTYTISNPAPQSTGTTLLGANKACMENNIIERYSGISIDECATNCKNQGCKRFQYVFLRGSTLCNLSRIQCSSASIGDLSDSFLYVPASSGDPSA